MTRRACLFFSAVALAAVWAVSGAAYGADAEPEKAGASGFAATTPPSVELGVSGDAQSPGGAKTATPGTGAPTSTDIDIAEVGRLMDAQGAGGNASTGAQSSQSATLDAGKYALRGVASLAFVLGLIVVILTVLRKYGRRSSLLTVLAGPGLATVLGKVHLARGTSLQYVETGGRVLVVGVTPTTVSLVAEFDAEVFSVPRADAETVDANNTQAEPVKGKISFLQQFLASTRAIDQNPPQQTSDDPDITQLRGDIERLQKHLQDLSRESRE